MKISWVIHNPLAPSQNHSRMNTSIHKLMSMHTAAGQTAVENIWRGRTPTCRVPLCCFAFLQRIYISRKTYSFTRPPIQTTKTHIWLRFLSALASSSSAAGLSSLIVSIGKISCPGSTAGRQHRISILSCTQWPTNLLDSTRHYTQLFPATFLLSYSLIPG